jgi:phage shock protein PspC (stress-responsive transcriptional regulator)
MKKNDTEPISSRLYRSSSNRIISGVAGGLGEYFNIDPTIIRILFIILTLFNGIGLLIYLLMWVLIPEETQPALDNNQTVKNNLADIKNKARSFSHNLRFNKSTSDPKDSHFLWAVLIIAVGFFFLFKNFGLFDALDLGKYWPVILIIAGLIFILRK